MTRKRRFQREDWLDLGLQGLSEAGPEAVKLEVVCKSAGLTRGSFYHHFSGHGAYLVALAEHWLKTQTQQLIDDLPAGQDPDTVSEALNNMALEIDYRLELGIRELARKTPAVAAIVAHADKTRLEVLGALYTRRFGLDADEAARFATLEYAAFNGIILTHPDMDSAEQRALAMLYDTVMQGYFSKRGPRA